MKITVTNTWQKLPYKQGTLYISKGSVCLATGSTTPASDLMGIVVTETTKPYFSEADVWIRNGNIGSVEVQVENFI